MLRPGRCSLALLLTALKPFFSSAAAPPSCTESARSMLPCELTYTNMSPGVSPFRSPALSIEFRSPSSATVRIDAFSSAPGTLRVRFTPTEPGTWTYRTTSPQSSLDGKEATFNVADSGLPGMIAVANVRHWRAGNRQGHRLPHLWMSAEAPLLSLETSQFESWLDARKRDGFTHVRGVLLTSKAPLKPLAASGEPNEAYFQALDDRLLPAASRGFVLDLILADENCAPQLSQDLLRYLVARYGSLNVTWQGLERFDTRPDTRDQLRTLGTQLRQFDTYAHPRSSDAAVSSSPLINDGWMDFLLEASPDAQVGAVEHQFTHQPQIHVITSTDPAAFRRELWSATASGEYPTVNYAALQSPENVRSLAIWKNIVSNTRHWEFEPFFDVSGASAVGLEEIEYLAYARVGGIVELTVPKHKYNPVWINPITGEEIPLKDYKGETFSRNTPDNSHDWILSFPRESKRESMNKYFYFESVDAPIQEVETDSTRVPFAIQDPSGDDMPSRIPVPYKVKVTRANRASRTMQYLWWGEIPGGSEGPRLLGTGSSGNLRFPEFFLKAAGSPINIRIQAINANGKAYEVDRVYNLQP